MRTKNSIPPIGKPERSKPKTHRAARLQKTPATNHDRNDPRFHDWGLRFGWAEFEVTTGRQVGTLCSMLINGFITQASVCSDRLLVSISPDSLAQLTRNSGRINPVDEGHTARLVKRAGDGILRLSWSQVERALDGHDVEPASIASMARSMGLPVKITATGIEIAEVDAKKVAQSLDIPEDTFGS